MARYIKREALPQKKERGFLLDDYFNAGWNACLNIIESIPDADVRPVVYGEWKLNNDGSGTCSVCHFTQSSVWDDDGWQNFCGHCGADMRKAVAEQNIVH